MELKTTFSIGFLSNRRERVAVNGSLSSWGEVTSGVPQGSVLGPILFVIYVNEVPKLVSSKIKIFEDDTKLYGPVRSQVDAQRIQEDLDVLVEWSKKWMLKFSISKCKTMHCGKTKAKIYLRHQV